MSFPNTVNTEYSNSSEYSTPKWSRVVLADRTNGRAYATMLRQFVCLSSVWLYLLWLNGAL